MRAATRVHDAAERAERRRRRRMHIKEIVDIYLHAIELGEALTFEMIDPGRALMEIMSRGEQVEMLRGILRRVDDRDRDEALELITTLLPYAKPRAKAPRSEIAGVSMFDTIVKASTHREHP